MKHRNGFCLFIYKHLLVLQVVGDLGASAASHDNSCKQSCDAVADRLDGLRIEEDSNTKRLETLLAQTKSLTAKQDLVQKLR